MTIHPLTLSDPYLSSLTAKNDGSGLLDNFYILACFVKLVFFLFEHDIWKDSIKRKQKLRKKPNRLQLHHSNEPGFATL